MSERGHRPGAKTSEERSRKRQEGQAWYNVGLQPDWVCQLFGSCPEESTPDAAVEERGSVEPGLRLRACDRAIHGVER